MGTQNGMLCICSHCNTVIGRRRRAHFGDSNTRPTSRRRQQEPGITEDGSNGVQSFEATPLRRRSRGGRRNTLAGGTNHASHTRQSNGHNATPVVGSGRQGDSYIHELPDAVLKSTIQESPLPFVYKYVI